MTAQPVFPSQAVVALLVAAVAAPLHGAPLQLRSPRPAAHVQAIPPGSAPATLQIRLRWRTERRVAHPGHTSNQFELVSAERLSTRAVAPRSREIGPDSLVLVAEDRQGRELAWRVVPDPRVVRAEASGAPVLEGERLVHLETELLFTIPALAEIARIRVYKPLNLQGDVYLDSLGLVMVAAQ